MNKSFYNVIGLMSGTSLDGVDLVYVSINIKDKSFEIQYAETLAYQNSWVNRLKAAFGKKVDDLEALDKQYGEYLADLINDFIKRSKIVDIDFIASHGHTIFHQPEKGITVQVGDGQVIANETGIKTIYDFRTQDVELGGQGAPLVPIGDALLFSNYDYCLNLGGFANISFEKGGHRIAYDICPVNIVMNPLAMDLGKPYDAFGEFAKSGEIIEGLLNKLNALSFYKQAPPKSLGYEFVVSEIDPLIASYKVNIKDVLRTFVEHCAIQIGRNTKKGKLLVTGGGAFNTFLIDRISEHCNAEIVIPNERIVNYKEALIFVLLGVLRFENQVNCLKSVTGASKDHCSGRVALPLKL